MTTRAEAFPLTCVWCKHAAATHVLVFDARRVVKPRTAALLCHGCAHRDEKALRMVAGNLAWLYELHPDQCRAAS